VLKRRIAEDRGNAGDIDTGAPASNAMAKQSSGSVRRSRPHAASVSIHILRKTSGAALAGANTSGGKGCLPVRHISTGTAKETSKPTARTSAVTAMT